MSNDSTDTFKDVSIIVGVSGSIAAYKAADLVSKLKQAGADVHVVMTRSAKELVGPMTFHSLSMNPVLTDLFPEGGSDKPYHIDLVDRADLMLIAPATANVIGKLSAGIGDEILSTTALAAYDMPIIFAPAMNVRMYQNPLVQRNIRNLEDAGFIQIEPEEGYLACGYTGKGRMAEVESILAVVEETISGSRGVERRYPKLK
jgi:phosphopantothenoylcysteine decarboxylase/phosphopantothenate--cysteine ligase